LSTRHLDALLDPHSVVLIGASSRAGSLGATAWRNLRAGTFKGAVYAVNPKYRRLDGQVVQARVEDLPAPADLALLCTPAHTVAGLIDQLGRSGTRAAVVLSSGLTQLSARRLGRGAAHGLRLLGPAASACCRRTSA
jgi:acetyltransferase